MTHILEDIAGGVRLGPDKTVWRRAFPSPHLPTSTLTNRAVKNKPPSWFTCYGGLFVRFICYAV